MKQKESKKFIHFLNKKKETFWYSMKASSWMECYVNKDTPTPSETKMAYVTTHVQAVHIGF